MNNQEGGQEKLPNFQHLGAANNNALKSAVVFMHKYPCINMNDIEYN